MKNQKLNGWLKMIVWIAATLIGVGVAWGVLSSDVKHNTGQVITNCDKIEESQKAIVELQTDVKYIRKGVDEIKEETS